MRFSRFARTALLVGFSVLASWQAHAADVKRPWSMNDNPFINELRFGVFDHDRWSNESGSVDLNFEVLFAKPFRSQDPLWDLFIPRPHLGGMLNTDGKTSHIYAGATWGFDIYGPIFAEASFGAGAHNGDHGNVRADRNALGCSVLFRESASLGWKINANWRAMATIEHLSNAGLCDQNRGLTNIGARIGYAF
jgi:lipid A 3-O-deacylase